MALVYRRLCRRDRRGAWRTWVFVVPFLAGLIALALNFLDNAMHGPLLG